ncbi:MAG: hypothetical protein D6766_04755 [Verrucomicrobia bacterium]|nr:MAG: hypothetical protein D6766_04755 [Verrucomicrobiota bacterium]
MKRIWLEGMKWLGAAGVLAATLTAAEFRDPVEAALTPAPPSPPGLEQGRGPLVLRPPDQLKNRPVWERTARPPQGGIILQPRTPRSRFRPQPPRVEFQDGDRVLLLGEAFEFDRPHGYLQTRMLSQWPDRRVHIRNLGWPGVALLEAQTNGGWGPDIEKLLTPAASWKPTKVFISLGRQDGVIGGIRTNEFREVFDRFLDRLTALNDESPAQLVIVSPPAYEVTRYGLIDAQAANNRTAPYILATWQVSTNRQIPFVNLFGWSIYDSENQRKEAAEQQATLRYYTTDGTHLNGYGMWRLSFGLGLHLRWPHNTWRFGLMADNTMRDGGFGMDILSHHRSTREAWLQGRAWRLPTPNPPGVIDLSENHPQCYIQVTGFDPGLYALQVDGVEVVRGTHKDWAKYRVIAEGPDWGLAEQVRRLVVEKTRAVTRWAGQFADPPAREAAEKEIASLEDRIAKLLKPPARVFYWKRIGDAPEESEADKKPKH